jgi:hypothetical protein
MGLDITAYSNLTYVGHHAEWADEDAHYDQHHEAYAYLGFPHALLGIPNVSEKQGYSETFLSGGCFETTEKTESYRFRAGSYSGYSRWRQDLAARFNPYRDGGRGEPDPEKPFYELIWFADNEGTIGQLAAVNLLVDFRQHEAAYQAAHASGTYEGDWFHESYADWTRACELAADGGLIDFH